jgi:hypothetical protein
LAVWTSSNRVFACRSPGLLAALAAAFAEGKQVSHAAAAYLGRPLMGSEPQAIARAAAQLAELARVEVSTSRLAAVSRAIIGGWHDQPRRRSRKGAHAGRLVPRRSAA